MSKFIVTINSMFELGFRVLIASIFILFGFFAHALTDADLLTMRATLTRRVKSYYQRLDNIEKLDAERRKGSDQMRALRLKKTSEQDKARVQFVKERKVKKAVDPSKWEAEINARKLSYEQSRKEYVIEKNKFKKMTQSTIQIPEDEEIGIDNYEPDSE
jgi:hypothetical protein